MPGEINIEGRGAPESGVLGLDDQLVPVKLDSYPPSV